MARVQDAKNTVSFAPENAKPKGVKPLNPTLKSGMSKDSPFHGSGYTKTHPSTKQLLDYANNKLSQRVEGDISKLSVDKQIELY